MKGMTRQWYALDANDSTTDEELGALILQGFGTLNWGKTRKKRAK